MPNKPIFYLFAAGEFFGLEEMPREEDFILAADAGYAHCVTAGLTPTLIMGDFDSIGEIPEGIPTARFPKEKDDTDTMLAIKKAIDLGFETFKLYGFLGGRLDHSLGNLQCLAYLTNRGKHATLYGEKEIITGLCEGTMRITGEKGQVFSLIPWGGSVEGLSITGAKYSMTGGTMSADFPLGISNEFVEDTVKISLKKGCLFVVKNRL